MLILKLLKEEKGASIVLVTMLMIILLGCTALVVDVGLLKINKTAIANALDAAALAGAQELPDKEKAAAVAQAYAVSNGIDISQLKIVISEDKTRIKISATKQINLLFAPVLGYKTGNISDESTAQIAPISAVTGLVPLAIEEQPLIYGEKYALKNGAGATSPPGYHAGWFYGLGLGQPGASTYEGNLTYGHQGNIKIGDIINIETGNISNPTVRAVTYRLTHCNHVPTCTNEQYYRDCSRVVFVPVIKPFDDKSVEVVSFAAFLLTDGIGQGNDCYVYGYFLNTILPGESNINNLNYGVNGVKLVK